MSPADDDSQAIASPEASDAASSAQAEDSVSLPELAVIGAAAEPADDAAETPDSVSAEEGDQKSHSTRERLKSRTREGRPRKKRAGTIVLVLLIVVLLGIVGTAVGGVAYLYWYADDDALDFQGTWYVAGTETPIEISADTIRLTDAVSYRYKLNTHDKTITLTLGDMTGYGTYRFSLDRTQLVIFDGRSDPDTVLEANIRWLVQALYDDLRGDPVDITGGIRRNRTLLMREPNANPAPLDSGAAEEPQAQTGRDETPQTVWSAEEWLNGNGDDGSGSADGASGAPSTPSTASSAADVGSLFEGINDLPASDTAAPQDAQPEGPSS